MKSITCVALIAIFAVLAAPPGAAEESWADSISFNGDFRPRYEYIETDGLPDVERARFRLRIGMSADVNDDVKAIFQLASGGDNPVSTNQTFGDGFSRKDFGIDLAYVDWTPRDEWHVYVGKMDNPIHRAGSHALIWDSDLNPEGVAASFESGAFFGTAGTYFVEDRAVTDDSLLLAIQAGVQFKVRDKGNLTAGAGYYDYTETAGNSPFWIGLPFGNSVDSSGNLIYDYNQLEFFAEYETRIGKYPLGIFVNHVQNLQVDVNDTGQAFGVRIGKADKPGAWQASWAWQELEADAVIGTFTDSDFGGGGTDARGHTIKAAYSLAEQWTLGGTLFLNEIGLASGTPSDFTRLQLDLNFSF